jgi:hypothetical protein
VGRNNCNDALKTTLVFVSRTLSSFHVLLISRHKSVHHNEKETPMTIRTLKQGCAALALLALAGLPGTHAIAGPLDDA